MMVGGFLLAFLMYIRRPDLPAGRRRRNPILYRFLLNKWYFDEIYDFVFVRGAKSLGRFLWKQGDGAVIDRLGPDGISARVVDVTRGVVRLQTGYVYHYAFVYADRRGGDHFLVPRHRRGSSLMFGSASSPVS